MIEVSRKNMFFLNTTITPPRARVDYERGYLRSSLYQTNSQLQFANFCLKQWYTQLESAETLLELSQKLTIGYLLCVKIMVKDDPSSKYNFSLSYNHRIWSAVSLKRIKTK